jgi:glycosyltransferase involved in cell wall biosynthesis/SAM-dependent methyltransferase
MHFLSWFNFYMAEDRYVLSLISDANKSRVLDVGCGCGRYLRPLRERGFDVVGVDEQTSVVTQLREEGFSVYHPYELESVGDKKFDIILVSHVVEHLTPSELITFLDYYLDRMSIAGMLIIASPFLHSRFYDDYDHVKPYTPASIGFLFSDLQQQREKPRHRLYSEAIWVRRWPFRIETRYGSAGLIRWVSLLLNLIFLLFFTSLGMSLVRKPDGLRNLEEGDFVVMVSVVIPFRNRALTLGYCLRSVLSQTFIDFEVILVDDGSTDDYSTILAQFNDPRVRVVRHDQSRGAQAARNTGIKNAKGKYVAFQDSDDEWYPDKLESQMKVIRDSTDEAVVVHGAMDRYMHDRDVKESWETPIHDGDCYLDLLKGPGPLFPTMLVPIGVLKRVGYLDEAVPSYQEWDTSISLAKVCRFCFITRPLAIYHVHNRERISDNLAREIFGYKYIIEKYRKEIVAAHGLVGLREHYVTLVLRAVLARDRRLVIGILKNARVGCIQVIVSFSSIIWRKAVRCVGLLRNR